MSFKAFFSHQARKPSGWFGRLCASRIFDRGNAGLNERMVELVDASGDDHVLEIGFGTGKAISRMADHLADGLVEGVDFSDAMMGVAEKNNRHHITAGKVKLRHGSFEDIPCVRENFNTICSANTIYFWENPERSLAAIHDALKPGGAFILAFVGKNKMDTMPLSADVFRSYSPEELLELMRNVGFSELEVHAVGGSGSEEYCIKAFK